MDIDSVIKELGQFGKYQSYVYFLLFFPFIHHSICSLSFVFTVSDLKYRCKIAECEENHTNFKPPWLQSAIPHNTKNEIIDQCKRYKFISRFNHDNCTEEGLFSLNETERCDSFIFETSEKSITNEFDLLCEENNWKRAAVGSLNNVAQFIGLPISGIISDRFGRKVTTIVGVVLSSLLGTLRSFSTTYIEFIVFEMLDAMASAGVYCSIFILGFEIIGPDMRGFSGGLLATYYPFGTIILGAVAWLVNDWRHILRILYIPGFIFLTYIWLLPESFRWLLTNGKKKKAIENIQNMAYLNGKPISDNVKEFLQKIENDKITFNEKKSKSSIEEVCSSKITMLRVLNCSASWIIHTFVFYGLSLNSVSIAGNKYLNFILVSLIELPAYAIAWYTIDTIGRRMSIFLSLVLSGITCTAFPFIDSGNFAIKLMLFLTGKFGITISFTAFYILASELFPTHLRNSLLGFSSTMGRIGSMLAPQSALLALYMDPVLLFGFCSLLGAFLALYFPETLNQKLPDTMEEAENIGKKSKNKY